jgi:anti-sigma regulatory factor (Ser/Thr protein kinase)
VNSGFALIKPVTLDVASDGQLVNADEPAMRLHLRAGGTEGGQLAIPALAALAAATHLFKMKMARSIKVADEREDIDLWVESEMSGQLVRLNIIGWQPKETAQAVNQNEDILRYKQLGKLGGAIELQFNHTLNLVSISDNGLTDVEIGMAAKTIFGDMENEDSVLLRAMEQRVSIQIIDQRIANEVVSFVVAADPIFAEDGSFSGYSCRLLPNKNPLDGDEAQETEEFLFGGQLDSALRLPLGRIIANAETIGNKLQGPIRDSYAVYAKDIADAARHLVALIDDLSDLEAIERPDFSTATDTIELGDMARRVAGLLALKAADHSMHFITPDPNEHVVAKAEFRRVLQILINLATNALRYSPDGTRVTISVNTNGENAEISVSDEGVGIEPENLEKIFNKFERLGRSGDGGSGLGLYISHKLARAMGGNLTVSTLSQQGTKFTLILPAG